jgi:hypothetical protein
MMLRIVWHAVYDTVRRNQPLFLYRIFLQYHPVAGCGWNGAITICMIRSNLTNAVPAGMPATKKAKHR